MRKALLLFTVLLFGLQGWAYDFTSGGLVFNITSASAPYKVSVANQDAPYFGEISIPSTVTYNGITYSVTSIGTYAFYESYYLTSVTIPSSITSIGEHAFHKCYSLTSIDIPSSVKTLGTGSFYGCISLNSVTIPSSVTSIGDLAFMKCYGLTSIDIPSSVTYIGETAFDECTSLASVVIPPSITSLTHSVFAGCSSLSSVIIPSSVTSIETGAFYGCSSLTSIEIPSSVKTIGEFAFANCTGLTSIEIPLSVTSLEADAFFFCTSLKTVTISPSVTSIGNFAFASCYSLTSISIPSSVTSIGTYAFNGCRSLNTITIPSSVVSLGQFAFEYCENLTSVVLNASISSIQNSTFYNCTKLTSVSIPSLVTSIEFGAFRGCSSLTSVTIPSSVTSIGSEAFSGCTGLISIYANNMTPSRVTMGTNAFYSVPTSTCALYVPTGSKLLYAAADQWKDFTNIVEVPLYAITTSANISTGGNVNGVGNYLSGNQCTISAVPNTGYSFANWTEHGTVVSTDASYTFTVTANRALVANFTENNVGDYTIVLNANPSVGGGITTGTGRYASGTTCIALATANTDYVFSNWTENGTVVSKDATYIFAISTARTLVANFIAGYTVTVVSNSSTGGSFTGAGGYATGASCTLTASANDGYFFSNWTENGIEVSKTATITFTVKTAHTFIANFFAGFIINATADASQGNITGPGGYFNGSNCTLQATPKTGYVFTGWTENGTVVSTNPSYTFTVSAAHTLVANFSSVTVAATQPTASTLSGSIVVTPSSGFTYSLDGINYQSSNEFPYVSIGTYNVTLKNASDGTVSSPVLVVINASGVVAANNYQIKATNCTCRDTKDGAIAVTLAKALDYTVTVTGINTGSKQSVMFSGTSYNLKNLPADTYKLVFKIDFLDNYEQSFNVVVTQPEDLSVLKVSAEKSRATYTLSGGTSYYVSVNDNTTETQSDQVQVSLVPGENKIKIYTEKLCQGVYEETIYNGENGQISLFPNPTTGKITLGIPGEEESVTAEIISLSGALQLKQKLSVPKNRLVDLDVSHFISGTYIVKVNGSTVNSSVKMMKKK